ncbi:MAG: putative ABC transporter permease [Clostridiales bacterium]|nr:putative ABC transporter permease [Clostridiales bacterium]
MTGRFMERLFRRKWWDYSEKRFNLDGYVCPEFSIFWLPAHLLRLKTSL